LSAVPAEDIAADGRLSRTQRLMRSLEITVPAAVLLVLLFFCFVWPLVYPVPSPVNGSVLNANLPLWSPGHILGTDTVGDDVMSRILYGGRVSFEVAAAVQAIGLIIGGLAGVVAG
jgi:peptide/nickel transport system permease protein